MPTSPIRVRPMRSSDIDGVSAAILASGWGDRAAWFTFAIADAHIRTFVAVDDDDMAIGTGVSSLHGPVAWIGTIWVAPERRGSGIGRRLTEATIDVAEAAGCRTLVLVASDEGRPLYERLGFATFAWEPVLEAPGLAAASGEADPAVDDPERRIRAWRDDDLEAAAALDAVATGEDRRHLLEAFASPTSAMVVTGRDDQPRGFVVRASWGGGATIASDPDDALALLTARRRIAGPDRIVRAGVIETNTDGIARLLADGWTEGWRARRMLRGEPLAWRPEHIWGQFNHAIG